MRIVDTYTYLAGPCIMTLHQDPAYVKMLHPQDSPTVPVLPFYPAAFPGRIVPMAHR